MNYTKSIFDETGLSDIWDGQKYINLDFFKVSIEQRLQDQYIQKWFSDINNSSRGEYYSKFKTDFKLENYLFPLNAVHRNYICKLSTRNTKSPIEWVFLGMKDYAIFVINALEMNSIIFCCCVLLKDIRNKNMPNYFISCPCETKMNTMLKIGNKANNKTTKLRTILQRESQNS